MSKFNVVIDYILEYEGGYSNEENDPGGETKYGITRSLFERVRPHMSFDLATMDDMVDIYKEVFWADEYESLDPAVALALVDTLVNHGKGKGIRMFQKAIGALPDGVFGPKTLQAAKDCNVFDMLLRLSDLREDRMYRTHKDTGLLNGLMNRLFKLQIDCACLYTGADGRTRNGQRPIINGIDDTASDGPNRNDEDGYNEIGGF